MLGAGGPRTYLVVFQNLAELRATGGMFGAHMVISADRGAIEIVEQGSATQLGTFDRPVLPLDPTMQALYTDRPGIYPADVNMTPDFPTAAALYREMYRLRSGRTVDGVLATDPVALSYVLAATGPVPVAKGEPLRTDNVVRLLLLETYARFSTTPEQDEYFATAAKATFEVLMRRPIDANGLLAQLARAAGERRILAWSADPAEERLLTGTVLDGVLPADDGARPTVGVFLNDGTGAKLDYYLTHSADLEVVGCRPDGSRELSLRIKISSTAPASGLSPLIVGGGVLSEPYTIRTVLLVFSPIGGAVVEMRQDGVPMPVGSGVERRRLVNVVAVDLKPGATRTIEAALLTGVPPRGRQATVEPQLRTTPGVAPWPGFVHSAAACGSV
jgi:hypothetical protein